MRTRLIALAAVATLAATLSMPAPVGAKGKGGPKVVGTDPADDWGANADSALQPIGDALGMEMVEASIGMADNKTVNFIIKLNSLPPSGGTPEIARYTWDFAVDGGDTLEIDGKFTNYSRGTCDPTSGQCPPPRDPGMQPFLLRGNCHVEDLVATSFTICEELAVIQATFDSAAGTITIPVPLAAMKAKPGSKITGMTGTFGGTISAAPSAFATYGTFPMDTLTTSATFVVPKS